MARVTKQELLEAIATAIREGMPSERDILEAIRRGVVDAYPYASEIAHAVYEGTRAAAANSK